MTKTVALKRETVASPRNAVRHDFLPKDAYLSKDFLRLENERMWPRVWQIACTTFWGNPSSNCQV